jgi:hypothetical protein
MVTTTTVSRPFRRLPAAPAKLLVGYGEALMNGSRTGMALVCRAAHEDDVAAQSPPS